MNRRNPIDRWLVIAGVGAWVAFVIAVVLNHAWVLSVDWSFPPASWSNTALAFAVLLSITSGALLVVRLWHLSENPLPLVLGFIGATLIAALIVVALAKWEPFGVAIAQNASEN